MFKPGDLVRRCLGGPKLYITKVDGDKFFARRPSDGREIGPRRNVEFVKV